MNQNVCALKKDVKHAIKMTIKIFDEDKLDEEGDMSEVKLDKEKIYCDKCNAPLTLSDKEEYECNVCKRFVDNS